MSDLMTGRQSVTGDADGGVQPTAAAAAILLNLGIDGEQWHAVQGAYLRPRHEWVDGQMKVSSEQVPHAWVEHPSGAILDISRRAYVRLPVAVVSADEEEFEHFSGKGDIASSRADLAQDWVASACPDLVSRVSSLVRDFHLSLEDDPTIAAAVSVPSP